MAKKTEQKEVKKQYSIPAGERLAELIKKSKLLIGTKESIVAIKNKRCSLVVYSKNCPSNVKEDIKKYSQLNDIATTVFEGDSQTLGVVCKKPFNISVLAVVGDSK